MSRIEECLVRGETQDIIYIGEVAERLYNGEGGFLLRALTNGQISEEAEVKQKDDLPADRRLGRIEAYQNMINLIEQAIEDGNSMKRPLTEEEVELEQGE